MKYLIIAGIFIFSFLLGSVPTAYVIVKLVTGKDLRKIGSGNIGGTNAKRAGSSKLQGYFIYFSTGIIDVLKGVIPVVLAIQLGKRVDFVIDNNIISVIAALLSIIGHDTMIFMRNGKGKGVAVTIGSFLVLAPVPVLIGFGTFAILSIFVKAASKRSILFSVILVAACFIMSFSLPIKIGSIIAAVLLVGRHKENIERMLKGQE